MRDQKSNLTGEDYQITLDWSSNLSFLQCEGRNFPSATTSRHRNHNAKNRERKFIRVIRLERMPELAGLQSAPNSATLPCNRLPTSRSPVEPATPNAEARYWKSSTSQSSNPRSPFSRRRAPDLLPRFHHPT